MDQSSKTEVLYVPSDQKQVDAMWWTPDEERDHCAGCSSLFTYSNRKHHCRLCGDIFCSTCLKHSKIIQSNTKPQKICDICFYTGESLSSGKAVVRNQIVLEKLLRIYKAKIRPLEQTFLFSDHILSPLYDSDFDPKGLVTLLGQYSVGKTTFIRTLLGKDYPGSRVGPEPTTDRFTAVMCGNSDKIVPGHVAAVEASRPFQGLVQFGGAFLNRFEVSEVCLRDSEYANACSAVANNNSTSNDESMEALDLLSELTLVDTPGVLSGEKQRLDRGYDYEKAVEWFAQRSDRIILLFDAHKLDISDEFRRLIEALRTHDDKVAIVLNKADMVDNGQLMRVLGALMWSLGKVIGSPEVPRVFIGSFWGEPLAATGVSNKSLFESEKKALVDDLKRLPANSATRKLNDFVKRVRSLRVHVQLCEHLRQLLPIMNKRAAAKRMVDNLDTYLDELNVPAGDLLERTKFAEFVINGGLERIPKVSQRQLDMLDLTLSRDIPSLLTELGTYNVQSPNATSSTMRESIKDKTKTKWIVTPELRNDYEKRFMSQTPYGLPLKLTHQKYVAIAEKAGCDIVARNLIWNLADIDHDKMLDLDEFCLASYLLDNRQYDPSFRIPESLPAVYIPPSKRGVY